MHLPLPSESAILTCAMIELIHPDSPSLWETARALVREYVASLHVNLDFQNVDAELLHFETEYAAPGGTFLLARNHGDVRSRGADKVSECFGCGALRRFSERECEMKRLYVRPAGRNLGIGRQLAQALIAEARSLGYERILLDTLPTMHSAHALYQSLGFTPAQPYRFNPIEGTTYLKLNL